MKNIPAASAVLLKKGDEEIDQHQLAHWMDEVSKDGETLQFVPEDMKTKEVCLAAVLAHGRALFHVPYAMMTPEICMAAVQQNGYALNFVPEDLTTPELCWAAIRQEGHALEYVPEHFRIPELCLASVQQSGYALQFVPEDLKTPELCLVAIRREVPPPSEVPLYLRAVRLFKGPFSIERADNVRDVRLHCIAADGRAIWNIPQVDQTPEFLKKAISSNFDVLKFVDYDILLQEGSEGLHEFLDESWQKVEVAMGPYKATCLAKDIMALQEPGQRERQVA